MDLQNSVVLNNRLTQDDAVLPQVITAASSSDNKELEEPSTSRDDPQNRQHKSRESKIPTTLSGADKASGIIGNVIGNKYHFFVAMSLCLNGYKTKQSNNRYQFTIKQECKGVGMFDDIIYKYRENENEEWARLLVQIKYKKTFDNKIKTSNLLFDGKNETFNLNKFMKSTKEIEDTDNCFFIIFTNVDLDLDNDRRLKKWYKKGVQDQIYLLSSKVSCVPLFDCYSQYQFNDSENIPIFNQYSGIDIEEDWITFLNKLVFVIGPSDLTCTETIIKQTIEDILPKSTDIIWKRLYDMVNSCLKKREDITSEQISDLFETVEEEIQEGHDSKYEESNIEFICDIPVYQFMCSGFTTLPIVTTNPELTLHKVSKSIKELRQNKLVRKYTMKHVYRVKDKKNASSPNLVIIVIKDSDQLEIFKTMKNDDIKYILIISNDQNLSEIQNCSEVYNDTVHTFKLLTDKSKEAVLNKKCISLNGQEFSFREILQVNLGSLTQNQVERLDAVITEDVLICYCNNDFKSLKLCFNREDINELGVYIKRRLRCFEDNKIEKFKQLYKTSNDTITEDELCVVDANRLLISDLPGMGKTFLVSSVFNELQKKYPAQIMIRLNFNDHTNSFSKKKLIFNNFEMTVSFIKNELLTKAQLSTLSRNVLNYILQNKHEICLFLDGFDEICPDYNTIVVNFIQSLKKYTNCKLFVTTRPGQTDILQRVLSTFALSIQPFTEEDKLLYLDKILESKNINTKALLEKINKNSELTELLAVPLLLKIVAETLYNENDDKLNINTIFNLSELFKKFINQKFQIYSVEKKKQNPTNVPNKNEDERLRKCYEKEHEILALKLLFDEESVIYKHIDYVQITKIGVITQVTDQRIEFIHRTFAEYYAAIHIQKYFNEEHIIELLFADVLTENDLTTLRQFLNNYIREKLNDKKTIDKCRCYVNNNYKTKNVNDFNWSILHTAAKENNLEIATFILECFKQNQNMLDIILSYGNEIALEIAIVRSNIEIAKRIITYCEKNKMNNECQAYQFTFGKGVGRGLTALHRAAFVGRTEVVNLLLAKGASVDIADTDGVTALHRAASGGHTEVTSLLLAKGAIVDTADTDGVTALHRSARWGHIDVVNLLLANDANVDKADKDGRTALYWAASEGHLKVIRLLLANGTRVNIVDTDGWTALHRAARWGHTDVVNLLIANGASVDKTDTDGVTALHKAASGGHTEVVNLLLTNGANMDITDTDGKTALYRAASGGHLEVMRLLLANGASVDIADTDGVTALYWAASEGHLEVMRLLLVNDASVDILDPDGWTALHRAASGGHTEVVNLLLATGASIDIVDTGGWTALHRAASRGHTKVVTLLLAKVANVDIADTSGWTALHRAASGGHTEVVSLLLAKNASVDIADTCGWTALHRAAFMGDTKVMDLLLAKNASADMADVYGVTALHWAARWGHTEVVNLLIAYGASVDIADTDGVTALHWAANGGHTVTVQQLIDGGADVNITSNEGLTALQIAIQNNCNRTIEVLLKTKT